MSFFSIKTKDADTVNSIFSRNQNIEFSGINVLQDALIINTPVFIVLGGDRPAWETGLIGMGVISRTPYDIGYAGRNFKIQVDMKLLLAHPIKREDLVPFRDTYGTIGIAPITKWEPNQALSQVPERNAIALMRAMLELYPEVSEELHSFVGEEVFGQITAPTTMFFPVPMAYGEDENLALQHFVDGRQANGQETQPEAVIGQIRFNTGIVSPFERNRIVFGAPGTGKSYKIKQDANTLLFGTGGSFERVTFHPEYSYSQFVGTYKPVSDDDGNIQYEFVPGPFIRIYTAALASGRTAAPSPFLLIVEEINRANVAAVFGDIFQLLDRNDDGVSEYEIQASEDIRKYLSKVLGGTPNDYRKLRLPDNLFVWASMNSADQGVFPMDTAFKRRWSFEYLGIDQNDAGVQGRIVLGRDTNATTVNWNELRRAINKRLSDDFRINEDKLLGPYFLEASTFEVDENGYIAHPMKFIASFKSKVIMYLFEDAARQHRGDLFCGCNSSKYSSICDSFDTIGVGIFGDDFKAQFTNNEE